MGRIEIFLVVLGFQLRTGVRVALRNLAPLAAGLTAAAVMLGSVLAVLAPVRAVLLSPALPFASPMATALLLVMVSAMSAPRLRCGLHGWMRHLPATSTDHRRAATVGVAVAGAPVLVVVLASGLTVLNDPLWNVAPRLLGLPVAALAAAMVALGECRIRAQAVAMVAAVMAASGWWWLLLTSPVVLILADVAAGPLPRQRTARSRASATVSSPVKICVRIALRALGWRVVGAWFFIPAMVLPALLFIVNNDLEAVYEVGAVRLAGLAAAVFVIAAVVDALVKRRPPWPWARSLPWPAGARVGLDALLLAVAAVPAVVAAGLIRPGALLPMLATVPLLALRGAAAVRHTPGGAGADAAQLVAEGLVIAALVTLVPWSAVLAVLMLPLALLHAADAEKRHAVGRWYELRHLAAGDSLSWSDS